MAASSNELDRGWLGWRSIANAHHYLMGSRVKFLFYFNGLMN